MIVVTGAAGLVGSNLVKTLNQAGRADVLVVESIGESEKWRNLRGCEVVDFLNYRMGPATLEAALRGLPIEAIFHVGANANVLLRDVDGMLDENFDHSKAWFRVARERSIPLFYASSSAVYGNSPECRVEGRYERPHNPYAFSKWLFDKYLLEQVRLGAARAPVIGFRLFNVFGQGEEHKGPNASLPRRFLGFLREQGRIDLFEGDISRDYVSVEAVCQVLLDAWTSRRPTGIVNLGAGAPITHREVAEMAVEAARAAGIRLEAEPIRVVPMPEALRQSFQFRTRAEDVPEWIRERLGDTRQRMKAYLRLLAG